MIKLITFFWFKFTYKIMMTSSPNHKYQIDEKLSLSFLSKVNCAKNICQEYALSICGKARLHKQGCFGILRRLVSHLLFTWDGNCRISTESLKWICYTPPRLTLCTWPRKITFALNSVIRCLCYKQTNKQTNTKPVAGGFKPCVK